MRLARAAILRSTLALSSVLLWQAPAPAAEPSRTAVNVAKQAFAAFDSRDLPLAERLFTETIDEWRRLDRGVEELTALLVARAGVRVDRTDFSAATADLNEAIGLMAPTGEGRNGVANYRESSAVQRGSA